MAPDYSADGTVSAHRGVRHANSERSKAVFRKRSLDRSLNDEMQFHIDMQIEESRRNGMTLNVIFRMIAAIAALFAGVEASSVQFLDQAPKWGLSAPNTFGGKARKESILETTGTGVAIFDYNGDGLNDVFIANGPPSHSYLYRNDGGGHFTEVAEEAGLTNVGWAQAVCVGDIDNDGHPDLFVTYYGHNSLYRNLGNGRFEEVTRRAGLPITGTRWSSGCAFVDYDRDGYLAFSSLTM
jgi:enediyne biosynthesis protein E4